MTDGDALYRAIVARPEDDTPRLVYADWLDENGHEEEAEFIRLECRLEESLPDHPEYTEWLDRREELRLWLQTHVPRQLKRRLPGIVRSALEGHNWWSQTSRGFPRFLLIDPIHGRLGAKGIRKLAATLEKAFAIIPTRRLVVSFPVVDDLAEFLKQPVVSSLNGITISTNEQAGDDAARIIAESKLLRNLRSAALNFSIGEAGADALSGSELFGQMDWFWLSTYQLTPQAIRSLGNGRWFRDLRELTLEDGLSAEAFEELCHLPLFPRLHTLDLSRNNFPVSSWQAFAGSRAFPQLTKLTLFESVMSNGQMTVLATANDIRLTALNLDMCSIGNEGARALITARWAETLRNLDLSRNLLGVSAATTIAGCGKFRALKRLNFAGNPIRGGGLKAIAESTTLQNLSTLLLSNCRDRNNAAMLSGDFQEFLQKLHMPNVRYLDLSNMPINSKAAQMLAGDKFRNLTRLRLAKCKLTDNAISALLSSPYLQGLIELDLSENHVKTGALPLTDRRILPRLSKCYLTENPLTPDLCRRLARRPGVIVPA
jgi:uncharacterized protein (TIGR02996 family)